MTSDQAVAPRLDDAETLVGEVVSVVFANEQNGFAVVELVGDGDADGARAAGPLAELTAGQPVRLHGRWTSHPRHGDTFSVDAYEQGAPQTTEGLVAFLSSKRFKGVGEVLAQRLVSAFGLDFSAAVAEGPEALARVRGVSQAVAQGIVEAWNEAGALVELIQRLSAAGVPAAAAHAVHRRFGDEAQQVLDADPYALLAARGITWAHVEALARTAGIEARDPRRLVAGAVLAHRQACARDGHVALSHDALVTAAARLLRVGGPVADEAVGLAKRRRALVTDTVPGTRKALWYTPADLRAERGLAAELQRLRAARSRVAPATAEVELSDALTTEQAEAVRAALRAPVSILTGGPGTGKTRTLTELVAAADAAGLQVALCAPTGRAAKRLEELTGHGASTAHRLLEARPATADAADAGFRFGYDASRRLPHDIVIADEWSMADLRLAWALCQAVDDGSHLLLVGDADQLPSVGAGAVLRDLLDDRLQQGDDPVVHVTRLTHVHRQAAASRIVTLAHQINAGAVPPLRGRDNDVFVVPERSDAIPARVAEIVAVRAPAFYGLPANEIQVLAPMYRGIAGVDALNATLKARLNPAAGRPTVGGFHEGDRVVQTRNDAELDVANGDIGEVVLADSRERVVEVAFAQGVVTMPAERAVDLRPAWCLTVHKSQGGEWPVVVLVCDRAHTVMLWRELVYTAVTRATQGLLLVGDARLVAEAARRTGSGVRQRRTALVPRLLEESLLNFGTEAGDTEGADPGR